MTSQTPLAPPAAIHLETIYEESDYSFSSSTVNIHPKSRSIRQKFSPSHRNDGLISARSIPSVDLPHHRRRRHRRITADPKPPIEVRFRDGSKRFIQPTSTSTNSPINRSGIQTKKKYSHSNNSKLNGKYRQVFSSLPNSTNITTKKSSVVLTIITEDDFRQAGISPPLTSSPDESETVTISKSHSNSSIDTLHTMNDTSFKENIEVVQRHQSQERTDFRAPQQTSTTNLKETFPSAVVQQKLNSNSNSMPPVAVIPPNFARTTAMPSLEITLNKEENDKLSTFNRSEMFQKTLIVSNVHQQQTIEPKGKISVGGSRSAFRPFHKQPSNNSTTTTTTTRILPTNTVKPTIQTKTDFSTSKIIINVPQSSRFPPQSSVNAIQQPIQHHFYSINPNVQSQVKSSDKSISIPSQPKQKLSPEDNLSDLIGPTLQWHSVTSKSLYDVPRLSHQYADIPLRITIPFSAANQNQKLVQKHDPILERRLFDAGLSPETIALYERVLEVADPQLNYSSEHFDSYSQQ